MNKKIILSIFLVLLIAISVSAVSAADNLTADDALTATALYSDADDIQEKINNAEEGATIELENKTYDVGNSVFNITKKLNFKGNDAIINIDGAGQGGNDATFLASASGISFEGITFNNTNGVKNYGEQISGRAIQLGIENATVDKCTFLNFNSGVYGRGAAYCNITNSYFTGSSTTVTNGGTKEVGTKAINLMGSHDITVKNCTFEGQVLDGISIASNSGNNIMTDNTFIDNCYAIYFGGASTQGCIIANNTFVRCGYCEDEEGRILFKDLPMISTQKAANGYVIADNTIRALDGAIFIKAESGNTAHGYPSTIGDINITGNRMLLADEDVDPNTITFVYILSNAGELSPYAPIAITGNTFASGITPVTVWYADWGSVDNTTIPAADPAATSINVKQVSTADKTITLELVDINGEPQAGQTIKYTINGNELTTTTDADGIISVKITEDGTYAFAFEGTDTLAASETSIDFSSNLTTKKASVINSKNMETIAVASSVDPRTGAYFNVTLTDADGNPLANKAIKIGFNAVVYDRVTDENGQTRLQINLKNQGTYTFAISFLGDDDYNASFVVNKIVVSQQTPSLTVAKTTYKASAATKTISATFKTVRGTAVSGKKITFTVNGKTYTGTTNSKGVASVKVSINKKGTYKFTAKYAGDNTFKAVSKSANLVLS